MIFHMCCFLNNTRESENNYMTIQIRQMQAQAWSYHFKQMLLLYEYTNIQWMGYSVVVLRVCITVWYHNAFPVKVRGLFGAIIWLMCRPYQVQAHITYHFQWSQNVLNSADTDKWIYFLFVLWCEYGMKVMTWSFYVEEYSFVIFLFNWADPPTPHTNLFNLTDD